jgi:hypothetical protein
MLQAELSIIFLNITSQISTFSGPISRELKNKFSLRCRYWLEIKGSRKESLALNLILTIRGLLQGFLGSLVTKSGGGCYTDFA